MRFLPIEEKRILENCHGELSPASYQLASSFPDTDYCVAGSRHLARLAENAFTRFTGKSPHIICLAPSLLFRTTVLYRFS